MEFFFLKILERDLKLACLIPTQCTGKASCSYCTGPHQLRVRAGRLCPRCSDDSLCSYIPCLWPSSLGWTCHHLTSIRFWTQTRKWADKMRDRWKTWACCDSWDDVCLNPPSWPTRWTGLPGSSSSLPSSLKSVRQSLQDGVWREHRVHKNLPFEL